LQIANDKLKTATRLEEEAGKALDVANNNLANVDFSAPAGWEVVSGGRTMDELAHSLQVALTIQRAIADSLHRVPDVIKTKVEQEIVRGQMRAGGLFAHKTRTAHFSTIMAMTPINTVNHEFLHALRSLGLFTKEEWDSVWIAYRKATNRDAAREARYRTYYSKEALAKGFDPESIEVQLKFDDKIVEEWAANDFGYWIEKRASERITPIGRLYGRIQDFTQDLKRSMQRLANRARGVETKPTVEEIFRAIEDGSIAQRWTEWGFARRDASNPLSVKSQAADAMIADMNAIMRDLAEDDNLRMGEKRTKVLEGITPCAKANL
jgi:hypothetical protein